MYFKEAFLYLKIGHTSGTYMFQSIQLWIPNKKDINFQYLVQNSQIKEVQPAKYLGVTLNNKLTWSDHAHPQHLALYDRISTFSQLTLKAHCIQALCYIASFNSCMNDHSFRIKLMPRPCSNITSISNFRGTVIGII